MSKAPASPAAQRTQIASVIAALFAVCSPVTATAATWIVDSCAEGNSGDLASKTGTLRFAAANALSGDTIDMTTLACSTITLKTGAIGLIQNSLTILGPGPTNLIISGKYNGSSTDRIFRHVGTGTLYLSGMSIKYGLANDAAPVGAAGGCVVSKGNVTLNHVYMGGCSAVSAASDASGGAIASYGEVTVKSSVLAGNTAQGLLAARGGAVFALSPFSARYSTIEANRADGNHYSSGGGIHAYGLSLRHSTIANNYSAGTGGGIVSFPSGGPTTAYLASSTISGNSAAGLVGGIAVAATSFRMYNSTIAFNTAGGGHSDPPTPHFYAPGLAFATPDAPMSATIESSLLSNNTYGSIEVDLSADGINPVTFNAGPAHNLIRTHFGSGLPGDTIFGFCPFLGPLRDNGGPTQTHQVFSNSIAIDTGSNSNGEPFDQRGLGYIRMSNGIADIGAYEVDQADIVFNTGFESCPDIF